MEALNKLRVRKYLSKAIFQNLKLISDFLTIQKSIREKYVYLLVDTLTINIYLF